MCTTNKGTQGDVTQTVVAKFGFALFPHKGANGDVNQIRLIKGKKNKGNNPPSPFARRLLHRLTPTWRRRCRRIGVAGLTLVLPLRVEIPQLCPMCCGKVKKKAFSLLDSSEKQEDGVRV